MLTILGGGPAGLGVAFYAHRAGLPFVLFEKSSELGGLCRTLRHGEHSYDSGAHRFHDRDPEVTRDVRELVGDDLRPVNAPSQIWDRGRFIDFPPTPFNAVFSYGIGEAARIGVELLSARWKPRPQVSFADFAESQFGKTLARRILLDYSEKVWGLPADQLSPDIATRRLHGMTLGSLLYELILPGKKAAHLDGNFLYPRKGYGQIVDALVRGLPLDSLQTGHEVVRLECCGGCVSRVHFAGGHDVELRGPIVSTLPLPFLVKLLDDQIPNAAHEAAAKLRFRHIRLVFLRLDRPRLSANASIYIPDPSCCMSRLYEPKNRSAAMAPENETSLVVEIPCFIQDPVGQLTPDQLTERVIDELDELHVLNRRDVIDWKHHFLANAYPVYSLDYSARVKLIRDSLVPIRNLNTIGRAGLFFYGHLHDQLRYGKDYVRALCPA